MHGCITLALLALVSLSTHAALAQSTGAGMLYDMSTWPQERSSQPNNLVVVAERAFFTAELPDTGRELWVTDGTAAGTRMVVDLFPGTESSGLADLQSIGDQLIFAGGDGAYDGLWLSDGTAAGTVPIAPAAATGGDGFRVRHIAVVGDCAWLSASDGLTGFEPWRYCLSKRQLVQVADIAPGDESSNPDGFFPVAGRVLFNTTRGLFASDARASEAKPFQPASAPDLRVGLSGFASFKEAYYFAGETAAGGMELWRTDGRVAGTWRVADLAPGAPGSDPYSLTAFNDTLYFSAHTQEYGRELWQTDGTAAGTRLFLDLNGGSNSATPSGLFADGTALFFVATDATGRRSLWRSDGSVDGTLALTTPGDANVILAFFFNRLAGRLVFYAQTDEHGFELWRTTDDDGIELIEDFCPGPCYAIYTAPVRLGDEVLFAGKKPELGIELWRSGGSADTTRLIANLAQDNNADSSWPAVVGHEQGLLILGPGETASDAALWESDGTPAGTRLTRNFPGTPTDFGFIRAPFLHGPFPTGFGATFGITSDDAMQAGQWIYRNGRASRIGFAPLEFPTRLGDHILSLNWDGDLWATTGEKGSMRRLAQIGHSNDPYLLPWIFTAGRLAWFFANAPDGNIALWRSDGTGAGTRIVAVPGGNLSRGETIALLGNIDDAMYFVAPRDVLMLWRADENGVSPVRELSSSAGWLSSGAGYGYLVNNRRVFVSRPFGEVDQLWSTDGTSEGTVRLLDGADAAAFIPSGYGQVFQGQLYFVGCDEKHGEALWRTDGTPAGTSLFADLEPGFDRFRIGSIAVHDGELYFVATTRTSGEEIWRTDGQTLTQVTELLPGTRSAAPQGLRSANGKLLFTADDGIHGRELWVLEH